MPIPWDQEKMSVNVKEIDEQHKYFLGLLNDLYKLSYDPQRTPEQISELLNKLIEYALFHFQTEEKYFDEFNYELIQEHKEKHSEIKDKVSYFKKQFEKDGDEIILELVDFLENWLVDHLESEDKKYTKCFNDHGLF